MQKLWAKCRIEKKETKQAVLTEFNLGELSVCLSCLSCGVVGVAFMSDTRPIDGESSGLGS